MTTRSKKMIHDYNELGGAGFIDWIKKGVDAIQKGNNFLKGSRVVSRSARILGDITKSKGIHDFANKAEAHGYGHSAPTKKKMAKAYKKAKAAAK